MTNVISDIPFFEGKHKTVGIVLIFIGVICFVAANHLKKEKDMKNKSNKNNPCILARIVLLMLIICRILYQRYISLCIH